MKIAEQPEKLYMIKKDMDSEPRIMNEHFDFRKTLLKYGLTQASG